ncbi:putative histone deacetylase complex subunit cti6 [Diplogelasinospora grovesii]|uniref:Histone deacetylase complex subunit cti6 n=1 Tax=Diplogelasinospora grovesii TaxID=303347 RepID=A0AAN6NCB0_9PEZI|nr:putative histone deacetylase complex subunit cti6 [Diplogelasinospora grovesii]
MAGPDPRRSSRARTTQSQSQNSSTASSLSGRPDRISRHPIKGVSPSKSSSSGSLSSEPPEDSITADDTFGTRRRTRGQGEERERAGTKTDSYEMAAGDDDLQDEDEAVRCICGYDDWPGPPPLDEDSRHNPKDANGIDPIFVTSVTDDAAGFFVQCDICKIWQHGACVGIMTEESSPDEYFCEECRRDLHKIYTARNGQRYSHYLPLKRQSRTTSRTASFGKDERRSPPKDRETRNGRASSAAQTSKRRSTMNSREAGYDEAEALRRAIEASKEDAHLDQADSGSKRPKRGRGDSEEKQESTKRQRTRSRSSSPSFGKAFDDSDDVGASTRNAAPKSKSRSAAARNQRTEKPGEKEERERQRADATNKRKGRSERRRADGTASTIFVKVSVAHEDTDSDPSEELPLAARALASRAAATATTSIATAKKTALVQHSTAAEPPPSLPTPDTPPTNTTVTTKADRKRSHKKKGRNQYTRDRDAYDEDSPARSVSRDRQRDDHAPASGNSKSWDDNHHHHRGGGKANSRAKHGGINSRITMTDMKRRAGAILDFISRTQVELAGETLAKVDGLAAASEAGMSAPGTTTATASATSAANGTESKARQRNDDIRHEKNFQDLNCMEMMDSLTRRLVKWQQEYTA